MSPHRNRLMIAVVSLALLCGASAAWGQSGSTRSDTGRHRPKPPPPPEQKAVRPSAPAGSAWFAGLSVGLQGGGDLWHVETVSQAAIAWESIVPFTSERFNASLDNDLALGVYLGRHLDERWSLRLDLGTSRMDVAAEALQGQQGAVFLYDRLTFLTVGLSAEVRLVRLPSYPYLNAGPVLHRISSAQWEELDQTTVGARVGLGYFHSASAEIGLRAEVRLSRAGFTTGDFLPRSAGPGEPELVFRPVSSLNIFEAVLAVQMNL